MSATPHLLRRAAIIIIIIIIIIIVVSIRQNVKPNNAVLGIAVKCFDIQVSKRVNHIIPHDVFHLSTRVNSIHLHSCPCFGSRTPMGMLAIHCSKITVLNKQINSIIIHAFPSHKLQNQAYSEHKRSLTFRVRHYVVIATTSVHRLQIRPIVHN